jgi:hypothetical protein
MAALQEAGVNVDKEGPPDTLKSVALPGPSSIGPAKGRRCREPSIGLMVLKTPLLKVVIMHGSRRSRTPSKTPPLLKTNTCGVRRKNHGPPVVVLGKST